jgi:hypothetical protein
MTKLLFIRNQFGGRGLEDHIITGPIGEDGIQVAVMEDMAEDITDADGEQLEDPGVAVEEAEIVVDLVVEEEVDLVVEEEEVEAAVEEEAVAADAKF